MKLAVILLIPIFFVFSCSRSNPGPTPNPTTDSSGNRPAADSLFSWKIIGHINTSPKGLIDIWFTSPSKGFVAAADGYLYQSLDSGKTWSQIPGTLSYGMESFFFLGNTYGFAQGAAQLQITRDGGATWTTKALPSNTADHVFFTNLSTGYYGDRSGLYKTSDTGNTWTRTFQSATAPTDYPVYFLDENKGFVLCGDGNFSTTVDGSASWHQAGSGIFSQSGTYSFNWLQFVDSLTGFYASKSGIFKTTDGGHNWGNVFPNGASVNMLKFFNATTGYYKSDFFIYKTTDGGQSWTTSAISHTGPSFISMFFIDSTTGWACTSEGAVLRKDRP